MTGSSQLGVLGAVVSGALAYVPQKLFREACDRSLSTRVPIGESFPSSVTWCAFKQMSRDITNPWNGLLSGIKEGAKAGYVAFSEGAVPSQRAEYFTRY